VLFVGLLPRLGPCLPACGRAHCEGGTQRALLHYLEEAGRRHSSWHRGSNGKMDDPVRKLFWIAANNQEGKFFNGTSDGQLFGDDHDSWQWLSGLQPFKRILRHGIDIVRDNDAIVRSSPVQDLRIIFLKDLRFLDKQLVERRETPPQPPQDPVVKILIDEQPDHGLFSGVSSSGHQLRASMAETFAEFRDLRPTLNLVLQLSGSLRTATQVLINNLWMLHVKGDGSVNAAERQGRKTVLNLFRGCTLIELIDDGVQRNARSDDPDSSVFIINKRRCLSEREWNHNIRIYQIRRRSEVI
jgi:hypothetical protein